jgi:hypothetical protein
MSKIILPHQLVDKQLKDAGVDGYIDPTTGLLLPYSAESERIIRERLEHLSARPTVQPRNNIRTARRRTPRKDLL